MGVSYCLFLISQKFQFSRIFSSLWKSMTHSCIFFPYNWIYSHNNKMSKLCKSYAFHNNTHIFTQCSAHYSRKATEKILHFCQKWDLFLKIKFRFHQISIKNSPFAKRNPIFLEKHNFSQDFPSVVISTYYDNLHAVNRLLAYTCNM